MRVTKKDGTFVVEDEPMRLEGKAARELLTQMQKRDAAPDLTRAKFIAECESVYKNAKRG